MIVRVNEWAADETVQGCKWVAANNIIAAIQDDGTELDIECCCLRSFPSCLNNLNLSKITTLKLGGNELTSFPKEILHWTQLENLSLFNNSIETVPPEIKLLSKLETLCLGYNKLSSLPQEIGELRQLEFLGLTYNMIESLPPEIRHLTRLETLAMNHNSIQTLPPEIRYLTNLTELLLDHNRRLKSLPIEIGLLRNLEYLSVTNNRQLKALPLSLGQLLHLTHIDNDNSGISAEQVDAILQQCRAARNDNAVEVLPSRLQMWKAAGASNLNIEDLNVLTLPQKGSLNEWLVRLEGTNDFKNAQASLAKTTCEIIQTVFTDKSFRKLFFTQVEANLESCQDRAAMALNEIYTAWKLATLPENASLKKKLDIMTQGAKTLALRAALAKRIEQRQKDLVNIEHENVEIYLYYESTLREELKLLTAIQQTQYAEHIGKRNWIDRNGLVQEVNATFFEHLMTLPIFEKEIEKLDAIKKIKNEYEAKMAKLENERPNGDQFSEAVLNFNVKLNELMQEREKKLTEAAKVWYEAI